MRKRLNIVNVRFILAYLGKGGMFIKVNKSYDANDPDKVNDLTNNIKEFIKNNTYAITIDFILLNNEINYLHSALIKYTLDPSGVRTVEFKLLDNFFEYNFLRTRSPFGITYFPISYFTLNPITP